ncbi:unnamed protein product [Phytophthora fragariaefolia]|uniref:Unnamed protein product n=1 Tax=Phytophthora fragariaefolia TaxID=1490495 RepID=A0A9W6YDV2_9STRA|nr:unnamed protein product [Phytophthora fragariaefolia]
MASPYSFISPSSVSSPHECESAWQLAEESKTALVGLEATLKRRNLALEQQVKQKLQETLNLSREKENAEQTLQNERRDFAGKREALWGEIDREKMNAERSTEDVQRLERRLSAQEREFREEKQQLLQTLREQETSFLQAANVLAEKCEEAATKGEQLEQEVQRLQKQLEEQREKFKEERDRWTQQGATRGGQGVELKSTLLRLVPHLRSLLEAAEFELEGAGTQTQTVPGDQAETAAGAEMVALTQNEDVAAQPREQESVLKELLEQASDAAKAQRDISLRNLAQREGVLTCPISLELFADPVVTKCCGKTFSSNGLRQALMQRSVCPFCRSTRVSYCPNRDVAKLVVFHRAERSILGLPEPVVPNIDSAMQQEPQESDSNHSSRSVSTRQSRLRDRRIERMHTRSSTRNVAANTGQGQSVSRSTLRPNHQELALQRSPSDAPSIAVPVRRVRFIIPPRPDPEVDSRSDTRLDSSSDMTTRSDSARQLAWSLTAITALNTSRNRQTTSRRVP